MAFSSELLFHFHNLYSSCFVDSNGQLSSSSYTFIVIDYAFHSLVCVTLVCVTLVCVILVFVYYLPSISHSGTIYPTWRNHPTSYPPEMQHTVQPTTHTTGAPLLREPPPSAPHHPIDHHPSVSPPCHPPRV